MSQHDQDVANQAGAAFRADLNLALVALFSNSSGASAPATMIAYQWWADTTTGLLKIRNAANSAWITVGTLATTNLALAALASSNNFTLTQYINDSANASMTMGLTINQGANDDEILALKSSDVAHGMTTLAETDTYAHFQKVAGNDGGLVVTGFTDSNRALALQGYCATAISGTRSTAEDAAVVIDAGLKSGTTIGSIGANKNIACIRDAGTARFFFDSDGDSHQDVGTAWTNFDDYEDVDLLTALSVHVSKGADPIRSVFSNFLQYNRKRLEELKLVTFNADGHHFVNYSQLTRLLVGAVRQVGTRQHWQGLHMKALEESIELLRGEVNRLLPGAG